jgi:hypothetical protein
VLVPLPPLVLLPAPLASLLLPLLASLLLTQWLEASPPLVSALHRNLRSICFLDLMFFSEAKQCLLYDKLVCSGQTMLPEQSALRLKEQHLFL